MERNVNYMIVGFVVILAMMGIGVFTSWVIGGLDKNSYTNYTVIFTDAVSGLQVNSPVEYKGVRVGQVTDIILDKNKPNMVQVNIKVKESTPIQSYTDVSLGLQGITGLSNIELETRAGEASPPDRLEDFEYPVLRGNSRQLGKLFEDMPKIANNILKISEKVDKLLDDKTLADLQQSIQNMQALTKDFNGLLSERNISTFSNTLKNSEEASKEFSSIGRRFNQTASEIENVAKGITKAIDSNQKSFDKFAQQGLDQALSLARESRAMAEQIRMLVESIKDNPSQLIYKQQKDTVKIAP